MHSFLMQPGASAHPHRCPPCRPLPLHRTHRHPKVQRRARMRLNSLDPFQRSRPPLLRALSQRLRELHEANRPTTARPARHREQGLVVDALAQLLRAERRCARVRPEEGSTRCCREVSGTSRRCPPSLFLRDTPTCYSYQLQRNERVERAAPGSMPQQSMALRQPQMRKRWDVRGRGQPLSTACGASGLQRSALLATSTSLCEVVTNLNTHTSAFRKREANLS
jgi:hypothetical protein